MTHTTTTTTRLATHHYPQSHPRITLRHFLTTRQLHKRTEPIVNLQTQPPSIPTCPLPPPSSSPACSCAEMPEGLDIERGKPLMGTMPPYAVHVVVRTGREDWGRRIEDEDGEGANFARSLKGLVGPGGKFFDPERPILITNSSLPVDPADPAGKHGPKYTSVDVFPSQVRVRKIPHTPEKHEDFVSQFLLGRLAFVRWIQARKAARGLAARSGENGASIPEEGIQALNPRLQYTKNTSPTILICGHNSRDTRCGILGPILRDEFNSYIERALQQFDWVHQPNAAFQPFQPLRDLRHSRVALTSHIGGHVFAGNVIIYLPKSLMMLDGKRSPLAGLGIWYGRVEPRHVWGIMEETLLRGNLIEELLRGVHKPSEHGWIRLGGSKKSYDIPRLFADQATTEYDQSVS